MRLIDADELLKEIVKRCGCIPYVESRKGEAIYLNNLISEQPTAYDLDKVVERLKENNFSEDWTNDVVYTEDAIKIVKSGGIE